MKANAPLLADALLQKKQQNYAPQSTQLQSLKNSVNFDSRSQAIAQRHLQKSANSSVQAMQLQSHVLKMAASVHGGQRHSLSSLAIHSEQPDAQVAVANNPLQRVEDDEALQAKFDTTEAANTLKTDTPSIEKANNTGLPNQLKAGIESLSGMNMDHVKVHYNSDKPAQLNAHAYAQGSDIHVAPGQESHVPHEAWHVVQQAQGRVRATIQMKSAIKANDSNDIGATVHQLATRFLPAAQLVTHYSGVPSKDAINEKHAERMLSDQPGVAQLRGANIPTADAMTTRARKAWFPAVISDTATYETIVSAVEQYYIAPTTDYSLQLYRIREMQKYLEVWKGKYGEFTAPVPAKGRSSTDERRLVLNDLVNAILIEVPFVQGQGFVQAQAQHTANTQSILGHIQAAEAQNVDRRLKNSADWILNGGVTRIYAATPTGDSTARIDANGMDINADKAFFPRGRRGSPGYIGDAAALYPQNDYMNQANVHLYKNGAVVNGWNEAGAVAIVNGATQTRDKVWSLLRHEVQHDMDQHLGRDAMAGAYAGATAFDAAGGSLVVAGGQVQSVNGGAAARNAYLAFENEKSLQRYKSEFRAYSYEETDPQSEYNRLDNVTKNIARGGQQFTARQLAIFDHIYKNYSYTKNAWDSNTAMADGRSFRRAIADYYEPDTEGFNKFNSRHVDAFYRALDAVGNKDVRRGLEVSHNIEIAPVAAGARVSNTQDAAVEALLQVIAGLTIADTSYIFEQCPSMLAKIDRHLEGAARNRVLEDLEWASS